MTPQEEIMEELKNKPMLVVKIKGNYYAQVGKYVRRMVSVEKLLSLQKQADCTEFEKVIGEDNDAQDYQYWNDGANKEEAYGWRDARNELRTKQHIALDSMRGKI